MSNDDQGFPTVFVACRRGSDKATTGQKCASRDALKTSGTSRHVQFRCAKCDYEWSVDQGGFVDY